MNWLFYFAECRNKILLQNCCSILFTYKRKQNRGFDEQVMAVILRFFWKDQSMNQSINQSYFSQCFGLWFSGDWIESANNQKSLLLEIKMALRTKASNGNLEQKVKRWIFFSFWKKQKFMMGVNQKYITKESGDDTLACVSQIR